MKDFTLRDLILKNSQRIYNNIAIVENIKGRLTGELQITPNPLVSWDFECLDETELINLTEKELEKVLFKKPLSSIIAGNIKIIHPYCRKIDYRIERENANRCIELNASGFAREFCLGDLNKKISALTFSIPNFRIHAISEEHNLSKDDTRWKHGAKDRFFVEKILIDDWMIALETPNSSFEWLDPSNRNTGILLTSMGSVFQNEKERNKEIGFWDILKIMEQLFLLFSFANGGYTYPILYEGHVLPPVAGSSSIVFKYFNSRNRITPLEQLADTWFIRVSKLSELIKCYRTFASVFDNKNWHDSFLFILANYFLATSTDSWQIAASSIGTILERLAFLLLIEDEKDIEKKKRNMDLFKPRRSKERLNKTLTKIGLIKDRDIYDIDSIDRFIDVRNEAVHPIPSKMTETERWEYVRYGIQWAEEIILWKLEYSGRYRDRIWSSKRAKNLYQASPGILVPRYILDKDKA